MAALADVALLILVSITPKDVRMSPTCEVKLTSERREDAPRACLRDNHRILSLPAAITERLPSRYAVDLSAEKYCSGGANAGKAVNITPFV